MLIKGRYDSYIKCQESLSKKECREIYIEDKRLEYYKVAKNISKDWKDKPKSLVRIKFMVELRYPDNIARDSDVDIHCINPNF